MKNSFVIGKIKGIQIEIDFSWFFIFALVTYSLVSGYFPYYYPDLGTTEKWVLGSIIALMLFVSVLLHELSHSLVSVKAGIQVKKITLFIFGGVAQIEKEPDTPVNEIKIALAGPAMSIFLFVLFMLFVYVLNYIKAAEILIIPFVYLSNVNLVLALFNLIPAFPLDGGRVLRALIWKFSGNLEKATKFSTNMGRLFGYLLILFGIVLILNNYLINGIWLSIIGWFVNQMSRSSYQSTAMSIIFDKIHINEFMTEKVITVDYSISVQELIDKYIYKYKYAVFPVKRNEDIIGVVGAGSVKGLPVEERSQNSVGSITSPLTENLVVKPGDTVSEAMTKLFGNGIGRVLVVDQGKLIGIVSKTDILNYLRIYSEINR
ncbi:MAG: site-2 protease family protein [Clostridiaceae bacterium]